CASTTIVITIAAATTTTTTPTTSPMYQPVEAPITVGKSHLLDLSSLHPSPFSSGPSKRGLNEGSLYASLPLSTKHTPGTLPRNANASATDHTRARTADDSTAPSDQHRLTPSGSPPRDGFV